MFLVNVIITATNYTSVQQALAAAPPTSAADTSRPATPIPGPVSPSSGDSSSDSDRGSSPPGIALRNARRSDRGSHAHGAKHRSRRSSAGSVALTPTATLPGPIPVPFGLVVSSDPRHGAKARGCVVVDVLPWSPLAVVDQLRPGDAVLMVDDASIKSLSLAQVHSTFSRTAAVLLAGAKQRISIRFARVFDPTTFRVAGRTNESPLSARTPIPANHHWTSSSPLSSARGRSTERTEAPVAEPLVLSGVRSSPGESRPRSIALVRRRHMTHVAQHAPDN